LQARAKAVVEGVLKDEADAEQALDSLAGVERASEKVNCPSCHRDVHKIAFDEEQGRCHRCLRRLNALVKACEQARERDKYYELAEQIEAMGFVPPPFNDFEDNIPF
jgi:transposase-like protein